MAESLKDWVNTHVKEYNKIPLEEMYTEKFFRDDFRPVFLDSTKLYSPADGILVFQEIVEPDEEIMDVKGIKYSLENILEGEDLDGQYMVASVFMTFYDIHINRTPTDGFLSFRDIGSLKTFNVPMVFLEDEIFDDFKLYEGFGARQMMFDNSRVLNKIHTMGFWYYVVQVADVTVNTITHFTRNQNDHFTQGERFSMIRRGSQCDLIVPLNQGIKLKFSLPSMVHVKAGMDALMEVA